MPLTLNLFDLPSIRMEGIPESPTEQISILEQAKLNLLTEMKESRNQIKPSEERLDWHITQLMHVLLEKRSHFRFASVKSEASTQTMERAQQTDPDLRIEHLRNAMTVIKNDCSELKAYNEQL